MLPGQRHLFSGILTPLPRQDFSHHTIEFLFSSAGRSWFSRWLGRKWSKSATFVLKLSRRPRREEGGEQSESNKRWQRIQMGGKKQSGWKKERETAGGREVRERAREKQRNVEGRERNRGLQLFNYSTDRQQRPRFQETITVCSPEGKAYLTSFISAILSPRKLQFGIFNVFPLLHKQVKTFLSLQMSRMPRSATWGGESSCWRREKQLLALNSKVLELIETVQTCIISRDSDYSYLEFEDMTLRYWIDLS